jgi:hypothetical protein
MIYTTDAVLYDTIVFLYAPGVTCLLPIIQNTRDYFYTIGELKSKV